MSTTGFESPFIDCCEGDYRCLACGHDPECPEGGCCHNFELVEQGWDEVLVHDSDCGCLNCDCYSSDEGTCSTCGHIANCPEGEAEDCLLSFHCPCLESHNSKTLCPVCHHRELCEEVDCLLPSHCVCDKTLLPELCQACAHNQGCQETDCHATPPLSQKQRQSDDANHVDVQTLPSGALERKLRLLEGLRKEKSNAEAKYNVLRRELLEGDLRGISELHDPRDPSRLWIKIELKERVRLTADSIQSLKRDHPEIFSKYAKRSSSTYIMFVGTQNGAEDPEISRE